MLEGTMRSSTFRRCASLGTLLLLLSYSFAFPLLFDVKPVHGAAPALTRPSRRPVFVGTRGDIEINVTVPGRAVKIEIPREFVPVSAENDTSFVWSTINEDYWYYNVTDASRHFPYDPNAPWYVIIWSWNLTGFVSRQIVRFKDMVAPNLAGVYNVTIYVATTLTPMRKPIFPTKPTHIEQIMVCRSRDWATITGYIVDWEYPPSGTIIKAKGVVYAFNRDSNQREARALVNVTTGFFNLTGIRPGNYFFEASAGYYPFTGYAYMLTNQSRWYPLRPLAQNVNVTMNMYIDRGARIHGFVMYRDNTLPGNPIRSLSQNPYLVNLGYAARGILNWTVEAYDSTGRLVAMDYANTLDQSSDPFLLVVGKGRKYVGADPVGTEFCGIGIESYTLFGYVFAYTQKETIPTTVPVVVRGHIILNVQVVMTMGAVISGTIRLIQPRIPAIVLETPRQTELRVCGTNNGTLFGGHVLIQAFRLWNGLSFEGLFVKNGTLISGVTTYADQNTIRFHILGFNEYYNRTYSGNWRKKEYGLIPGTYNVKVYVRGYRQVTNYNVTMTPGENATITVDMEGGGAVKTTMVSGLAWPCTTKMQMYYQWLFFNANVSYRARVYHYDEGGVPYGYTEKILAPGQSGVSNVSATATFSGMNYDISEVVYWGAIPTVITPNVYEMKAFTYGYIQASQTKAYVEYYCASARATMLVGCAMNATGVLLRSGVFYRLKENVTFRAEVLVGGSFLVGSEFGNASVSQSNIRIGCRGFGGRGHFFFVTPDGVRHNDYGYGKDNYLMVIRRFGYLYRFEQASFSSNLPCYGDEVGAILRIPLLNKVFGVVRGPRASDEKLFGLSWARIDINGTEVSMSLDGYYWLFMNDGQGTVTCTIPFYYNKSVIMVVSGGSEIQVDFDLERAPL